jgi:hypothetical protein
MEGTSEYDRVKCEIFSGCVSQRAGRVRLTALVAAQGAYVSGLIMEGARWEEKSQCIDESRPKELFAKMPIILIKAVRVFGHPSPLMPYDGDLSSPRCPSSSSSCAVPRQAPLRRCGGPGAATAAVRFGLTRVDLDVRVIAKVAVLQIATFAIWCTHPLSLQLQQSGRASLCIRGRAAWPG